MAVICKFQKHFLFGLAAAISLLVVYFSILALAQDMEHAFSQFVVDKWFILPIDLSFGLQMGLYSYLRSLYKVGTAVPAASGGVSAVSMALCCAHHLIDILPIVGLSVVSIFFARYSTEIFIFALAVNFLGLIFILSFIKKEKSRLKPN